MMTGFVLGGPILWGGLEMIFMWLLVMAGALWFAMALAHGATIHTPAIISPSLGPPTPLDILKARWARHEITQAQFEDIKRELGACGSVVRERDCSYETNPARCS